MKRRTHWIPNYTASVLLAGVVTAWLVQSSAAAATGENDARAAIPNSTPAVAPSVTHAQRAAVAVFSEQHPRTRFFEAGSRITQIYGRSFGSGHSPEDTAQRFKNSHARLFGVAPEDLRPFGSLHDNRHTQPLMYDRATGQYKFTLVYYTQHASGIPVFRADLRLLIRNEPGHALVLANANLRVLGQFAPPRMPQATEKPELGPQAAAELIPSLGNFSEPERVIWAGVEVMIETPTIAYTFTANNHGAANATQPESWLFVADAATGKILYEESLILDVDVVGNVSGMASQGPGADICAEEVLTPLPYARVKIGATQSFADENGDFVIPNGGGSQVTVQSPVRGEYFVVSNAAGSDTVLSTTVTPPGPADFVHNAANTSELIRAEVNAYVESNAVRDWILEANPDYPQISTQTEFSVVVNRTDGFCPGNAWYDGSPLSINFCRAGGGSANTAWSSVVHHEYGHRLVAAGGSGQGAYGEGTGDVMSTIILDDPRLGLGFFGSCSSWLRSADNTLQYPCSGAIHFCGQLLSGCVWDTRNELLSTEPFIYSEILMNLMVNSVLLHSGSGIAPSITIDWLTLDDNDDNIGNGTPHYNEIAAGFGDHNLPAPPLELIDFIYPDGRPDLLSPNIATVISVNVEPINGTPVPGTGTLSYRIGTDGPFATVAMAEAVPNEYEATLPGTDCLELVQYYFTVDSEEMGGLTDPPDAPATALEAVAATSLSTFFEDDFESNWGWSVTNGGGLGDGAWTRGFPVDCNRGDPHNDADGSGQCYLTDNSSANGCNSDVDNGSTTLTSPVMDASHEDTTLSYDRWYSNTEGEGPMQDIFVVQVSDDDGASWVNLETVGPSGAEVNGGWFHKEFFLASVNGLEMTDQFRIRFTASDTNPQSIVEAGVDHVRLFAYECEDSCPADLSGDGNVGAQDLALLLGSWGPNPGDPADLDGDDQVGAPDLAILLGSWGACS